MNELTQGKDIGVVVGDVATTWAFGPHEADDEVEKLREDLTWKAEFIVALTTP